MTREECIEILDKYAHHSCFEVITYPRKVAIEAFEIAIAALKAEPCEDAVSRQTVLNYIRDNYRRRFINDDAFMQCVNGIKNIVPVTPKQRTSVWVAIDQEPHETWECGLCGFVIDGSGYIDPDKYIDIYKYCPHCGAKMEGEGE